MFVLSAPLALTSAACMVVAAPARDADVVFPTTRLTVDASAVAEGGDEDPKHWESIITSAISDEFRLYHIPVITLDEQATFDVNVSWAGESGSTDVAIEVVIQKHGSEAETRTFVCKDCEFAPGAAERIVQELPTLVPLLELPAQPNTDDGSGDPPAHDTTPRVFGPLGWVGLASAVVGAGLTGGGIYLGTRQDTTRSINDQGERLLEETYPQRTAGIAMAAVGGAALVGGVVMMVVDARRQKDKHRRESAALSTIAPTLQAPGFVLTGRF